MRRLDTDEELLAELRWAADGGAGPPPAPDEGPPDLGRYRVLGKLGEGGMGIVYEAEQRSPRRSVALKVMHGGLASERALGRFAVEAELLGRLEHPGVARVFEAGTFTTGRGPRPFFAMELVRGERLDRAARGLGRRALLELFASVCDAVHHAHQKGVIHRDLKPANVLVTPEGRAKVVDFGVARATDAMEGGRDVLTRTAELVGTLPYMSPEQVSGDPEAVDTRSDVYALGVILYELLAGRLPLDARGLALPEAARRIAEEEPPRLGSLDPSLRGDLETIAAKALAKDVHDRYASAAALADDVRRHLAHETIAARPVGTLEQLARFARRNRALAVASGLAVLALLAGIAATWSQAVRAGGAEDAALAQADRALRLASFTAGFLGAADPWAGRRPDATIREALDDAAALLDEGVGDPLLERDLRAVLGNAYASLGLAGPGRPHLERRLALTRELGRPSVELARAHADLAWTLNHLREPAAAEEHAMAAHRALENADGEGGDGEVRRDALGSLAHARLAGTDWLRAEEPAARALALAREGGAPDGEVDALVVLAEVRSRRGDLGEALELAGEAVAVAEETYGAEHPLTAHARLTLASVHLDRGEHAEAAAHLADAERVLVARLGAEHPEVGTCLSGRLVLAMEASRWDEVEELAAEIVARHDGETPADLVRRGAVKKALASAALGRGAPEEALRLLEEADELFATRFAPDHPRRLKVLGSMGTAHEAAGRRDDAAEAYAAVVAAVEAGAELDAPSALSLRSNLASLLFQGGRVDEAAVEYRAVLDERLALYGESHAGVPIARNNLGRVLLELGEPKEAEDEIARAYDAWLATHGADSLLVAIAARNHADALVALDRLDEAEARLDEAETILEATLPAGHRRRGELLLSRGHLHARAGRDDAARSAFEEAAEILAAAVGDDHPTTRAAREGLRAR